MPNPTSTFVLDIGRHCNINCKFCYYHHLGDLRKQGWKTEESIINEITDGVGRGNTRVEVTGGEPTLYQLMPYFVKMMKNKGLEVCIITNGLVSKERLRELIYSGVDEFLISIHGTEKIHDELTMHGARELQELALDVIDRSGLKNGYRFNFVINSFNQLNIYEAAQWMSQWQPTIVNFINMNPHGMWQNSKDTKSVIADLRIVETQLDAAIKHLESSLIDVNLRYYPMCRVAEKYRRCVCNDLHVMFDPKEWDYCTMPKTFERYKQWGIDTSNNVEEKGEPCCRCDLQWVCGGVNKHFHKASNEMFGELILPQKTWDVDKNDFYHYRKDCFFEKEVV